MRFTARTNRERKIEAPWHLVNEYAKRWRPGTELEIEIVRKQRKVSDPMRKWYFAAVLPPFMRHLGYDPEETLNFHRQLKIVFFQVQPDERGIYREKDIPSVFSNESELPVSKKVEFAEWVIRKAAEYGVIIDDPTGPETRN